MHALTPNDIKMQFKDNPRHGRKAVVPALFNKSQQSTATHYENSFAVKAAWLWSILPKVVTSSTTIGSLKGELGDFLSSFLDNPPTKGYTAPNNTSLLELNRFKRSAIKENGGRTWYCFPEAIPAKQTYSILSTKVVSNVHWVLCPLISAIILQVPSISTNIANIDLSHISGFCWHLQWMAKISH
jgi:hypothetical protein